MTHLKILQIVPRLPPDSDGVGDYARLLAKQLYTAQDITTEFLSFCPRLETPECVDGFRVHRLFDHSEADLLSLLPDSLDGILLHYSNYPYLESHFNAPFWLTKALRTIKAARQIPVVVMFHELPTLKWKRIRVLNPVQSLVSRGLSRLASAVVTDSQHFKHHLEKWTGTSISCIPDFSTIGEPDAKQVRSLSARKPRMVIFGGSDRIRAYQHLDSLLTTCQALNIEEIYDVGAKQATAPDIPGSITFKEMGFQSAEAVQALLLDSQVGFMDYSRFPGDLAKSSVFAAFCAHGVLPVCTAHNPSEADGIVAGQQYAVAGEALSLLTMTQHQQVAEQARSWYCEHTLDVNAALFTRYFSDA